MKLSDVADTIVEQTGSIGRKYNRLLKTRALVFSAFLVFSAAAVGIFIRPLDGASINNLGDASRLLEWNHGYNCVLLASLIMLSIVLVIEKTLRKLRKTYVLNINVLGALYLWTHDQQLGSGDLVRQLSVLEKQGLRLNIMSGDN